MPNVLSRCFWNHPTRLWRNDMTTCLKSWDLHFGELQIWVPFSHFDLAPPKRRLPESRWRVFKHQFSKSLPKLKINRHFITSWICEGLWRCEVVTVVFPSKPQQVHVHERLTTVDEWLWPQEHDILIQQKPDEDLSCNVKPSKILLKELRGFGSFKLHMWTFPWFSSHNKIGHFEEKARKQWGGRFGGRWRRASRRAVRFNASGSDGPNLLKSIGFSIRKMFEFCRPRLKFKMNGRKKIWRTTTYTYIYIYTSFICSTVYLSKFHTRLARLPSSILILSKDWIYPRWPFPFLIKYLFPPRDNFLKHLATTDCEACLVERKYMIPLDVFKWHFLTESRWCTDIGGHFFLFVPVYSWHYGKILWLLHSNVFAL